MPVRMGKDANGCYAMWGSMGKKYRYECMDPAGRKSAREKAAKQGQAARSSGYGGMDYHPDKDKKDKNMGGHLPDEKKKKKKMY